MNIFSKFYKELIKLCKMEETAQGTEKIFKKNLRDC